MKVKAVERGHLIREEDIVNLRMIILRVVAEEDDNDFNHRP
jgi:hypothetical protein